MGTISEKLQAVIDSKAAIKAQLVAKGVNPSDVLSSYADRISEVKDINYAGQLPLTVLNALRMKDGTTANFSHNQFIKVLDVNGKSWTLEEWHNFNLNADGTWKTPEAGKNSVHAEPIAFDINAFGKHFLWYFKSKYTDPAAGRTYYDVTGTTSIATGAMRHSHYRHPLYTTSGTNTDTVQGQTKTATRAVSNGVITLSTTNSPLTWSAPNKATVYAWMSDDAKDRYDYLYAMSEWFRHRCAIDSGLTSLTAPTTDISGNPQISILNASGEQAAVGEDMYFWVNGINTNLLAKYNVHSMMEAANPSQAIVDYIYGKQKDNGVNMNDTGVNSSSKPIRTEGSKGAEVYGLDIDGVTHWMIATPVLTNAASGTSLDNNIPDAPAVYYCKWLEQLMFGKTGTSRSIVMPDWRMGSAYWCNRSYALTQWTSYLNTAASKGEAWGVPAPTALYDYVWCSPRSSGYYAWYVSMGYGYVVYSSTCIRYICCGVSALS